MERHEIADLKKVYYTEIMQNGLPVIYIPNDKFSKCYVSMAVNFGAIDQEYIFEGKTYQVPSGMAHFIEHKLFEIEDNQDAFLLFSNYGASSNAYTTLDKTFYLFETTKNLYECLDLLLHFTLTPHFKDTSIEKEKSIILEERRMYMNAPLYQTMRELFQMIYSKNYARNEVLGTEEDIKKANALLLNQIYKAFYHPSNMVLTISGNFSLQEMQEYLKNYFADAKRTPFETKKINYEDDAITKKHKVFHNHGNNPTIALGMKLKGIHENFDYTLEKIDILMEMLFGETSKLLDDMIQKELVHDDFSYTLELSQSYGILYFQAITTKSEEVLHILKEVLTNPEKYLSIDDFYRAKKSALADFLFTFNSINRLGDCIAESYLSNEDFFALYELLQKVRYEEIVEIANYLAQCEMVSLFTRK